MNYYAQGSASGSMNFLGHLCGVFLHLSSYPDSLTILFRILVIYFFFTDFFILRRYFVFKK